MSVLLAADDAFRVLRENGLRLTPQRRAVITVLANNHTHPSADTVAREVAGLVPGVSRSTVYATLRELADLGLVREMDTGGPTRFDAEVDDHAHVICDSCGSVLDVALEPELIEGLRRHASGPSGEVPVRVDVTLHAPCTSCALG